MLIVRSMALGLRDDQKEKASESYETPIEGRPWSWPSEREVKEVTPEMNAALEK